MASAKIEDRKLYVGGPWDSIKGDNPVLSKGLFKPPMDPLVTKYDNDKSDYQKLLDKKGDLKALLQKCLEALKANAVNINKVTAELDKEFADGADAYKKSVEKFNKCLTDADPDPAEVLSALTGMATDFEDGSTVRKTLHDKVATLQASSATLARKGAADYKTQSDAIVNGIKKLEDDMNKLDDQIRKLVQSYQQIAAKAANKDDNVADAVRGLLKFLP